MTAQSVLVTGGIGSATGAGLAALGARVGIVGRDPEPPHGSEATGAQLDVFVAEDVPMK